MLLRVYVESRLGRDRGAGRRSGWPGLRSVSLAVAGVASVLGCGPGAGRASSGSSVASDSLAASLIVQVRADGVRLVLQVTNAAGSPIPVTFATYQRFDFAVSRGGQPVWTWSADQVFPQAMTEDTLAPAETWRFEAAWAPSRPSEGTYVAQARLVSTSHPVQALAEFQLP